MVRVVAALLLVVVLAGACAKDEGPVVVLDGRARRPDAEGVVDQVSRSQLTLDGHRYAVSAKLQAFSTYTLQAVPVLARRHQYVQVGLDGDTVEWLAAYGAVVRAPGAEPTVYYTGVFRRMEGGRAVFRDGSSLRLAGGIAVPRAGTRVRADIDPERHEVRALTAV
jgi:hypothetical protein